MNETNSVKVVIGKVLSNPIGRLFIVVYSVSLAISFHYSTRYATISPLHSLGILAMTLLVLKVTEGREVKVVRVSRPWTGLSTWIIILLVFELVTYRYGGSPYGPLYVISKFSLLGAIPLLISRSKGDSRKSMGLTFENWRSDLRVSLVLGGVVIALLFFFDPETWRPVLSGEMGLRAILLGFALSFSYFFLTAGFPEEVFFRARLQGHLSSILKSRLSALLLASLIFGWLHVLDMMRQHPGIPISVLFAQATLLQTCLGLFLGTIWERTRSLLPPVLTHSLVDSVINLEQIIREIGL